MNSGQGRLPKMNKIAHISVHDISKAGFTQNPSSKFSILLLEIFRVRVKVHFAIKMGADFYLCLRKNLAAKIGHMRTYIIKLLVLKNVEEAL
jgi:hypothetical protein